jgi:AraC-like DNA-binding protein
VTPPRQPSRVSVWRHRSLEVQRSEVVAGRVAGPEPPRDWQARLRRLIEASRQPEEGPAWWTPMNAYFGSLETRSDPAHYHWDGMKRLGRRDRPLVFFQFTIAGHGQFELYGKPPQPVPPGASFFAVVPSRHRYYLPADSPGWTFGWIGIYHPYLIRRIAKQVELTGPVLATPAGCPLIALAIRLVSGAFRKDFRDRFAVELALFEFTIAYERLAQELKHPESERERLLGEVRNRVVDGGSRLLNVDVLAAERGMSRSRYSRFFRERTGLTPARFMADVRIQEAARLLTATRLSLEDIAQRCGFASRNHFGKVFRAFRHQSPAVYRRSVA